MEELAKEYTDPRTGIHYTLGEDELYYPDIHEPSEQEMLQTLGKYGRMAARYLKENKPWRYSLYVEFTQLGKIMREVDKGANELLDQLETDYIKKHPIEHPGDFMETWQLRTQARMVAEEVVIDQVVNQLR